MIGDGPQVAETPEERAKLSHFAGARILVVDDEPDVLAAYEHVFGGIIAKAEDELATMANEDQPYRTPL